MMMMINIDGTTQHRIAEIIGVIRSLVAIASRYLLESHSF
jgi:hypothetical protein